MLIAQDQAAPEDLIGIPTAAQHATEHGWRLEKLHAVYRLALKVQAIMTRGSEQRHTVSARHKVPGEAQRAEKCAAALPGLVKADEKDLQATTHQANTDALPLVAHRLISLPKSIM